MNIKMEMSWDREADLFMLTINEFFPILLTPTMLDVLEQSIQRGKEARAKLLPPPTEDAHAHEKENENGD